MKEGWNYMALGDVCEFVGGYTPSKELLSEKGKIPYFKVSDMNAVGNELYMTNTSSFLSFSKKTIPNGSIVFPKNGGAIYTNKKRILGQESVVDLNTEALCPNDKLVSTDYLFRLLLSIDLGQFDNGGGLPSINIKRMKSFVVPIPPLSEQQRIVSLLDAEITIIDTLKVDAERNLQNAKDLFQAALKKELKPKEGWQKKKFGDVCKYQKEQGHYSHLKYVGMENIETGSGKLLGLQNGADVLSTTFKFHSGYVMYGRLRPYLKKVFVADFEGCCSTEIFPIETKELLPHFLMYWFLSDTITDRINATCAGCRMPRANMNDVLGFDISVPELSEQQHIVARLDALNEKCKTLQANYEKTIALCDDLKQALLRKAFKGEL